MVAGEGKSAYLDDAGHPIDKPFLVLGGCISTESRWIEFERPWKEILSCRKLPFPFHATDFFREHAKDPKLKHIVSDLIRTISNHIEAAFSVGLDMEAYKAANREKRLEEFCGAPIAMVSRSLREQIDHWRTAIRDKSPLLYLIEEGTYQRGDMEECWKYIDQLNPPIPVSKKRPSAQAADLYAYSAYQSAPFDTPSWQHQMFHETFVIKGVHHADSKTDLETFLSRDSTHIKELGRKVPIPDRELTKDMRVIFERNKNKQQNVRRAKIGILQDRTSKIQRSDKDNS